MASFLPFKGLLMSVILFLLPLRWSWVISSSWHSLFSPLFHFPTSGNIYPMGNAFVTIHCWSPECRSVPNPIVGIQNKWTGDYISVHLPFICAVPPLWYVSYLDGSSNLSASFSRMLGFYFKPHSAVLRAYPSSTLGSLLERVGGPCVLPGIKPGSTSWRQASALPNLWGFIWISRRVRNKMLLVFICY